MCTSIFGVHISFHSPLFSHFPNSNLLMVKVLTTRFQLCQRARKQGIIIDECIPNRTSGNSGPNPSQPGIVITDLLPGRSSRSRIRPSRRSFSTEIIITDVIQH